MQLRPLFLAAAIAVTTASCGSDSPSEPGPGPSNSLECEVRDYPCSLSEVPLAILERGDALGDEALAMLEAGGSTGEAAAWLQGQPDVAEVEWDETAIWFRPEGGTGIWILGEGAFAPEVGAKTVPGAAPSDPPAPRTRPALHVVGPDSEEKKALVLSPFHWQVPDIEDTPAVADILSATRGYEGRVTYRSNQEETSTAVGLDSFKEWDGYQVVHVSTHGKRVCTTTGCRGTLVAGTLASTLPPGPGSKAEKLKAIEEQGVSYAKSETTGREYLVLNADFFRYHYPGGLADALVFINACQSFGPHATDLVEAIRGDGSVVLGWSESVYVSDATAATVALYQALAERGYPAGIALEEIGELAVGRAVNGEASPELRATPRRGDGDLRIREVILLLHPGSGQELTAADVVAIEGTMGDGEPDAVPWLVQIDGVKPELADGMSVRVLVAGAQSDPVPLTAGQASDEDQWTVSGAVLLPFDVEEATRVTFGARLNLHDGGVSEYETDATLSGEHPIMGTVWEMEAVHTSGWTASSGVPHTPYTATARLILSFAPGQSPTEPHPRYEVTGGTVTYDYNHTYYDCTYSAPVLTFEVTEEVSLDSELRFDTTANPVRYSGVIYTQGPEFEVVESCGEGSSTRTHRAANTWLLVESADALPVSADSRSITGTDRQETSVGSYIQRDYTITRTQ